MGRFFCGFACPLGTINQATGWLGRRGLPGRPGGGQSPPPGANLKYYFLAFRWPWPSWGRSRPGLFDPLPLLHRSVNLALAPLADNRLGVLSDEPRLYTSAWFIGAVFLGVVGLKPGPAPVFLPLRLSSRGVVRLFARLTPWRIGKT